MAILNPEAESAAKVASDSESKQRQLAEAGYKHVEGAPAPLPLDLPHFSLRDLRAAIPKHCFERSFITSTYYMIKNVLTCAALFYAATYIDQTGNAAYLLWPVYWFFQGSYLTGVWVVAHECGHQAYCSSEVVNNMIGLVLHSALLVPYHSWRISHRKHHSNTGSCENDEVFVPVTRSVISSSWNETLEDSPLYQLYRIVYMLVVGWMPGYLFFNATGPSKYWGKPRSHFNPYSAIYADRERWMIILSDIFLVLMISFLAVLVYTFSFYTMLKFYVVPYFIVNAYLVLITYLQHTDTYIPHFREGEWNWLRGALCTVDRSFGPYLDSVVHRIVDTHVCHHIFSKMPFYHCEEATNAIKPLLGKFYLKDTTPVPLALWRSYTHCKFVEDDGKVVFYKNKL
ncbi:Fatty acid desaturase [Phytophthora palmivora]|uniref:Fatty acid desaturase n=1 Tax=Phytophthora palmivora TaxID=4796 RepID=A0A2P4XIX8_9STRA|nr:Fatty acid desaturase [Phytophthora palmivora]